MIKIEDIRKEEIKEFWSLHYSYLVDDGVISDDEDKEYFQSGEYRDVIEAHMTRDIDSHHLAYFTENGKRIGAVSYCTYISEDGKCFVLDFWIFAPYRNKGLGGNCFSLFSEKVKGEGAKYFEINCDGRADRIRFWKRQGFVENGLDEYGVLLLVRKEGN